VNPGQRKEKKKVRRQAEYTGAPRELPEKGVPTAIGAAKNWGKLKGFRTNQDERRCHLPTSQRTHQDEPFCGGAGEGKKGKGNHPGKLEGVVQERLSTGKATSIWPAKGGEARSEKRPYRPPKEKGEKDFP